MDNQSYTTTQMIKERAGMLLQNKIALIYGAGAVGSAVARAFAREAQECFSLAAT
ncbi:MAG: hypothetical protein ACRDF4_12245 [Rhabdochlamydiaceae bacterium]